MDRALFEDNRDNVWLQGNRAPVREERTVEHLEIAGELPEELSGILVRNGPNPRFAPNGRYHWWDGDGMIHAVHIEGGRASYRNRWVRTKGFVAEQEAGRSIWRGLMYPPDIGNPKGQSKNPSNTNVMLVGDRVLSLWEGGRPYRVRLPSLETEEMETFGDKLQGSMTAHPHRDLATGETLFFGYNVFPPLCTFGVVDARGNLVHHVPLELPAPSIMHDFVFTERFAVICDFPCKLRIERAMRGENPICWEPEHGSRFGVIPRRGSQADIRWLVGKPGYVFHFANAYDEGDKIIIHASRMEHTSFAEGRGAGADVDTHGAARTDQGSMYRYELDLRAGRVIETPLDDRNVDFVRVSPGRFGKPYRFTFGSYNERGEEPGTFDHLIKYDHARGTSEVRSLGEHGHCGEAVFVPRPRASDEDDGWVLALTHDEAANQSELLVLNAQDFTGEPAARVRIPCRVPYGFHAEWITAEELRALR